MDRLVISTSINEGLARYRENELLRVRNKAKIELDWWGNSIINGQQQDFVTVPKEGRGFRLTSPLRNDHEPRLLCIEAMNLLVLVSQRWINDLRNNHVDSTDVFLSVSSLYRSSELQGQLVQQGANAAKISSHQAGAAIDFDPSGYYQGADCKSIGIHSGNFHHRYIRALDR